MPVRYLFFLGSQDRLSRAELLTLLGQTKNYQLITEFASIRAMLVETNPEADIKKFFHSLGGSVKVAKVLQEGLHKDQVLPTLTELLAQPELSAKKDLAWNVATIAGQVNAWPNGKALRLYLQEQGRKVRVVGKFGGKETSSATLYHLLPKAGGLSLNLIINGDKAMLAQDVAVQDLRYWRTVDLDRPYRNLDEVGMLPPKLARMMVNIARLPNADGSLWDPFCGTGTVLLQGLSLGYSAFGSDLNKENVRGTQTNIEWLIKTFGPVAGYWRTFKYDVTKDPYKQEVLRGVGKNEKFSAIVSEPYLGPISHQGKAVQAAWRQTAEIYEQLFRHAYKMVVEGGRLVLVKPVFRVINKTSRRQKEVLWYNPKVSFNKGRWRLLGQEYADLWWRDNVHAVRRLVQVWEKI